MLVLSRKKNQNLVINGNITVTVVDIQEDKVRLGVVAPVDVSVHRQEVYEAIHMPPQDLARAIQAKPLKTLARSVMAELPDEESLYQRLTDSARAVLRLARVEAREFNHEYVGTEHMLLGIVRQATGIAADVLRALDIDLPQIRLEVEKIIQAGPDAVVAGQLPLTPRAKKAIEYALDEAAGFGSSSVGTQHLLLGLLREEEGVGGQVLLNVGLSLTLVRRKLLDTLGHVVDKNAAAAFQMTRETELPEAVRLVRTEYDRQIAILQAQREAAVAADDPFQLARLRDHIARLTQSRELLLWMFREPVH